MLGTVEEGVGANSEPRRYLVLRRCARSFLSVVVVLVLLFCLWKVVVLAVTADSGSLCEKHLV